MINFYFSLNKFSIGRSWLKQWASWIRIRSCCLWSTWKRFLRGKYRLFEKYNVTTEPKSEIHVSKYHPVFRFCKNWLLIKVWRGSEMNTRSFTEHLRLPMSLKRDLLKGTVVLLDTILNYTYSLKFKITTYLNSL